MLICHSFYYLFIDMNSKAKIDPTHIEVDKSDISMHSEVLLILIRVIHRVTAHQISFSPSAKASRT